MGNKIFDINGATIRLKNKGTIRFVNQGCRDFRWRGEDDWNPRDKFWFSPLLMQSACCILCRRLNSPRRSGFGTLPWHRGSDVPSSPFLFPLSLSLSPLFFLFSIHSVTDISRVSESRKRDLYRSLRKKDSQGSFRSDCHADPSLKSGHREKPKSNRIMEFRIFIL